VTVTVTGATATVEEAGATNVTPQAGCVAETPKRVRCTLPNAASRIQYTYATLLDGNDDFEITGSPSSVDGGVGNDDLTGGELSDALDGGGGTDDLRGNAGRDTLSDGDASGVANKDKLDGGADADLVDYRIRTAGVVVDLAAPSGDGEPGENDTLTAIENVGGGAGADTLRGDENPNILSAAGGDDAVDGRGGIDAVYGFGGNDTLIGGAGRDDIEAGDGDDTLRLENPVRSYDRLLTCGAGNDTIIGIAAAPSVSIECEVGDFGFGFVAGLKPKKVTKEAVTVKIPCPDVYKKDGVCKGTIVVEPKGAYAHSAAERAKRDYGARKFAISKSTKVTIKLNAAGRKELRKSAFRFQFTLRLKETATGTKRQFEWTSYLVRSFLS